jgi:tRNA A-37 threonylcarbamoyl transferase component Bud32
LSPIVATHDLDYFRRELAADPSNESRRWNLADAFAKAGEYESARDIAIPLMATNNTQLWERACSLLASLAENTGRNDEAATRWEALLAIDIDHPTARAHLLRLGRLTQLHVRPQVHQAFGTKATLSSPKGVVAGRYEILSQLGTGTTGTVFLARDTHLDLRVALKVLHPYLATSARSDARQRFFREAQLAASLRHPGVVAVYDLDQENRTLSLEYFPMGTLRDRLSDAQAAPSGKLEHSELAATLRSLLVTLAFVHNAGLVHGDIKPRNILLREPGQCALGDFGVARLMVDGSSQLTQGAAGTPLYFAPELLRGASSNTSTDLFALGAVAWELVAGQPMRTRDDLVSGRFEAPILPFEEEKTPGPEFRGIAAFIAAATSRDPGDRPPTAQVALGILDG